MGRRDAGSVASELGLERVSSPEVAHSAATLLEHCDSSLHLSPQSSRRSVARTLR